MDEDKKNKIYTVTKINKQISKNEGKQIRKLIIQFSDKHSDKN